MSVFNILYRFRAVGVVGTLCFIIYCIIAMDYTLDTTILYRWQPDSQLVLLSIDDSVPNVIDGPLSEIDLTEPRPILTINGRQPIRGRPILEWPLQDQYTFVIDVDGQEVEFVHNPTPLSIFRSSRHIASIILPLACWLVGSVMLIFTIPKRESIYVGYIFIITACNIIGIYGVLDGIRGAWVFGYALMFFQPVYGIYLGLMPRGEPVGGSARRVLQVAALLSAVFAALATYEVLFLFPQPTSFQEISGISMYRLGYLAAAINVAFTISLLLYRRSRVDAYIRRQIQILLAFSLLGFIPSMTLTILPKALFDIVILPFPWAITNIILVPLGYLFVLYRTGYLGLELIFSRFVHIVAILTMAAVVYFLGLSFADVLIGQPIHEQLQTTVVMLVIVLLIVIFSDKPLRRWVTILFYGKQAVSPRTLVEYTIDLSRKPDYGTLQDVTERIALDLDVERIALVFRERTDLQITTSTGPVAFDTMPDGAIVTDKKYVIRTVQNDRHFFEHDFYQENEWIELVIPLRLRETLVGALLFEKPRGAQPFNSHEATLLSQVAATLAVAYENITLFESMRAMSRDMVVTEQLARRKIASEIHDGPQQYLYLIQTVLKQMETNYSPELLRMVQEETVKMVADLRKIGHALTPKVLTCSVQEMIRHMAAEFENTHQIEVNLDFTGDIAADEHFLVRFVIYRILIEAFNNIVKHAEAEAVWVFFYYVDDEIQLCIEDNGKGIQLPEFNIAELFRQGHYGIVGMYEWVSFARGDLKIDTHQRASGTTLEFCIPMG